ncbi:hypothetical protein [Azospirillum argentinense]|uniref:hypothetical protein n=1 Tax=Azospirillum argentinense TaxID=2970906 RepID=UPI0032DFA77F
MMIDLRIDTVLWGRRRFADAEAGFAAAADAVERAPDEAARAVSDELMRSLQGLTKALVAKHGSPWPGMAAAGGDTLHSRSGAGLRALVDGVTVVPAARLAGVRGTIRVPGTLAGHEDGAIITPRRSKYLTVPLPAALDGRGVPLRRSARDWQDTFVAPGRGGSLVIFQRRPSGAVPLYVLKRSVRLRPRLGLESKLHEILDPFARRAVDAIVDALDRAT